MVVEAGDEGAAASVELLVAGARLETAVDLDDHTAARSYVDEESVDDDLAQHQVGHRSGWGRRGPAAGHRREAYGTGPALDAARRQAYGPGVC